MRLTKQLDAFNTPIAGKYSLKDLLTYTLVLSVGIGLSFTTIFRWNFIAYLAYFGLVFLLIGETPTGRSMLSNLYGIIFKKPVKMIVTDHATVTTIGHGIRNIEKLDGIDAPVHTMVDGNVRLVYTVTSNITYWSSDNDFLEQASGIRKLFNLFEGGEGFCIVVKDDLDTGMLQLRNQLLELEDFEGDDLRRLSDKRSKLLEVAGTKTIGESVQQFVVLSVKRKNINKYVTQLRRATRLMRVSSYPTDVLLAAMSLEGGIKINGEE